MTHHLQAPLYLPLEREHEGWVVRGIEDYAIATGLRCRTFAVSQTEESAWGADEVIGFRAKVFGLQFKRPYVTGSGIYWEIEPNSAQFSNICANTEIFYALPSFVNRTLKYQALQHCFFWRPCTSCARETLAGGVQNCLGNITRQYREDIHGLKMRWGDFVEELYTCTAGKLIDADTPVGFVLADIKDRLRIDEQQETGSDEPADAEALFVVALELPS